MSYLQRMILDPLHVCCCSTLNLSLFPQSWLAKVTKLEQRYTCSWSFKTLNNLIALVLSQNPPSLKVTLVSIETLSFAVPLIFSIEEHPPEQEVKTGCPKHYRF